MTGNPWCSCAPERRMKAGPVDWLGDLPEEWHTRPLWSMFHREKITGHVDEPMVSVFRDHGVVFKDDFDNLNVTAEDRSIYQLVEPAWLVVNRMKAWQGSVGISTIRGISSGHYLCFRPTHGEDPRFLNWLLRSPVYRDGFALNSRGVRIGQAEIDNDRLRLLPIVLPPHTEQQAIADFLDRETAQIDATIDAQQRLIRLLDERERVVVLKAVSTGLGELAPEATMESGLMWAGRVPSHWSVGNIRRFAAMKTGHTPSRQVPEYWVDCEIPWFTLADVWQLRSGISRVMDTAEMVSEVGLANSAAELLPTGTVMVSRTASVGFFGIMGRPMATSQDYWNWVCGPLLDPEYLLYSFRAMRPALLSLMAGSTHKTIYEADAAGLRVLVPPLAEQRVIVEYLENATIGIKRMRTEAQTSIDLLRERRAALITAAVTGRIDPRTGVERLDEVLEGEAS